MGEKRSAYWDDPLEFPPTHSTWGCTLGNTVILCCPGTSPWRYSGNLHRCYSAVPPWLWAILSISSHHSSPDNTVLSSPPSDSASVTSDVNEGSGMVREDVCKMTKNTERMMSKLEILNLEIEMLVAETKTAYTTIRTNKPQIHHPLLTASYLGTPIYNESSALI